jgi:hypothetical protein
MATIALTTPVTSRKARIAAEQCTQTLRRFDGAGTIKHAFPNVRDRMGLREIK